MRTIPTVTFTVFTLLAASLAAEEDCPTCKYDKRGDRREGVGVRQVSGATFDLLSVEIQPAGKVATGGDQVHLWFWLPGQETPTIEVWEPRTNYWMVPEPRAFAAGLQSYVWPRGEVLARLKIDLASLRPKIRNRDETLYYPTLVTTSSRPEPGGGYAFFFRSGAGIDVSCTISRDEGGKLTPVREFELSERFGGVLRIPWNGRDDQGKLAPEGVYVLRLTGDMLADPNHPLTFNLSFLHHGQVQ